MAKPSSEKNAEQILAALRSFHTKNPNATVEQTMAFHMALMEKSVVMPQNMTAEEYNDVFSAIEAATLKRCDYYGIPRAQVAVTLSSGTGGFYVKQDSDKFVVIFHGKPNAITIDDACRFIHHVFKLPVLAASSPKRIVQFSQETGKKFRRVNLEVPESEFFEHLPENAFSINCVVEYTITHKRTGESVSVKRERVIGKEDSHILFAAIHQISQSVLSVSDSDNSDEKGE